MQRKDWFRVFLWEDGLIYTGYQKLKINYMKDGMKKVKLCINKTVGKVYI